MNMHFLRRYMPYIFLSVLCFSLYLPGIFTIPMDDRDSAHFAQATRQMMETGNYFQIRYQDVTRYQKPPGINWLQAASVKLFSSPESTAVWPYRLPSVIGGWLSVLLTFWLARRFFSKKTALFSAIILACTLLLGVESHLAVIDSSLLVSMLVMQGSLWIVYDRVRQHKEICWQWGLIFFLSMSYGFLLKGVTPLVGFLTLITLSFLDKTTVYFKALRWHWGVLLLLGVSAAWLIGVSYAEHTNYLMQMLERDLLPKLAGGHESHGAPFGSHLALLCVTFWPFSLFLWPMGVYTWQQRRTSHIRFLLAWILPVWLFFELMPTKLPQYILPTFPALAMLAACAILSSTAQQTRTMRVLAIVWGVISVSVLFVFMQMPAFLGLSFNAVTYWIVGVLVIASIAAVVAIFQKNYTRALIALVLGSVLGFSSIYQWFLPSLTPVWTSEMMANAVKTTIPANTINDDNPLFVIGYGEPSLVFLLGTHTVKFGKPPADAKKPYYVFVDSRADVDFSSAQALKTITSFNYNKGQWVTLTLYKVS